MFWSSAIKIKSVLSNSYSGLPLSRVTECRSLLMNADINTICCYIDSPSAEWRLPPRLLFHGHIVIAPPHSAISIIWVRNEDVCSNMNPLITLHDSTRIQFSTIQGSLADRVSMPKAGVNFRVHKATPTFVLIFIWSFMRCFANATAFINACFPPLLWGNDGSKYLLHEPGVSATNRKIYVFFVLLELPHGELRMVKTPEISHSGLLKIICPQVRESDEKVNLRWKRYSS